MIGRGSSLDFGYKFVLCKSRGNPTLVKERCLPFSPGDSHILYD